MGYISWMTITGATREIRNTVVVGRLIPLVVVTNAVVRVNSLTLFRPERFFSTPFPDFSSQMSKNFNKFFKPCTNCSIWPPLSTFESNSYIRRRHLWVTSYANEQKCKQWHHDEFAYQRFPPITRFPPKWRWIMIMCAEKISFSSSCPFLSFFIQLIFFLPAVFTNLARSWSRARTT